MLNQEQFPYPVDAINYNNELVKPLLTLLLHCRPVEHLSQLHSLTSVLLHSHPTAYLTEWDDDTIVTNNCILTEDQL